ncbi:MAG TPA: class II aldolase/adducin family protein [Methylovirgula sp.]
MKEGQIREALVENCRALERQNLNQGTSGNLSARCDGDMLITPTGVPYDVLTPRMIAKMPIAGEYGAWSGPVAPSSEWRIHLDILRAKPEVGAVVHTHSLYATTLSLLHKPIPAVHYMIAAFGGPTIRCTKYAPFGTQELSDLVVDGLSNRDGVLLGQHGMVVTGRDLGQALWRAVELETLAKMYLLALSVGRPRILSDSEILRTVEKFKSYGYQPEKMAALEKHSGKTGGEKKAAAKTKNARTANAAKPRSASKKTRSASKKK